jgi:uncharacterized protein DUF4255/IPT/TIG domain-containing protein
MSDFLAVAGVTAVLRWMLREAVAGSGVDTAVGATPTISALPPDRIVVGATEIPQVNIFMYHVSLNSGWRNVGLPELDPGGRRVSAPPLAIDLHFLLSAYGPNELDGEILLGWAMQVMHEQPVLTRDLVQTALSDIATHLGATAEDQQVGHSTLADQAELIRLSPQSLSTEEVYRLWPAFNAHYRATAAYLATVVLVQRQRPIRAGLPVQVRNILVQPMERPVIEDVSPGLVATGEQLVIAGRHFVGDSAADTTVIFDDGTSVPPDTVQDAVVRVTIPPTLLAGVRGVQITRKVRFGSPGDPHQGIQSNLASFMLLPTLLAPPASTKVGTTLTLTINPPIGRRQRAAVLIGSQSVEIDPRPSSAPAASATLDFPIPASFAPVAAPGAALRVRIDGAESRVQPNPAPPPAPPYLPLIVVNP